MTTKPLGKLNVRGEDVVSFLLPRKCRSLHDNYSMKETYRNLANIVTVTLIIELTNNSLVNTVS